jgi:signal transduction histidine kinase
MIRFASEGQPLTPRMRADRATARRDKVRGQERLTHQAELLSVLNAIAAEASRTLHLSELLDLALDQMIGLTGMEGGAALLVDEKTRQLTLAAERNLPEAAKELMERSPLSVGQGIPGIAAEGCELLIVENSKDDERELPAFRDIGVMTHVCIPLAVRGSALGVLGMIDRESLSFKPADLTLFTAVGEQLGIAIERARLFDRQTKLAERLQTLNELMRIAVSGLDVADVFDRVGEQVRKLIHHDRLSIALRPHSEDYHETYAFTGDGPTKGTRFPLEQSGIGEAIRRGRPILRRNLPEDGTYPDEIEFSSTYGIRSAMFVPLESRGRVIGSLNFGSRQQAGYSERELQDAQEIANHLSVVVEHTLLYEQSRRAEATLLRLNKELAEASRHKSEFLAHLSHELRTPLNAVIGASELLRDGLFGSLNEKQTEYARDINDAGTHLLSLINDVLDLSKVEAGKLELQVGHFSLRSLMESSAAIVRERAASKSLELRMIPSAEDIVVEADERKIKQIVYNLLSNAVKFTPKKGKVVFTAHCHGDEVVFTVEDTGPGVAPEFQESIFEEFYQMPGSREGTGLGLALCKKLVELHGGRIWLESDVGRGSRFSFAILITREARTPSSGPGATQ